MNVYLGRESSRGTGVVAAHAIPKATLSHDLKTITSPETMSYGSIGEGYESLVAQRYAQGTLEGDILDKSFGLILYAALGSLSTSGPSDSAYTHSFSLLNSNQHPSLSIHVTDPVGSQVFELSMLNSLEINVVPGDSVKFVAEFMSKEPQDSADQGAAPYNIAYVAANKFLGRHCVVKVASATSGLAAASRVNVKSLTLRFVKNTLNNFVLGTVGPADILNQKFEVTGEVELDIEDRTYRNYIRNATYRALRIQLSNIDALIGASTRPSLTIDLSRVFFESWEPSIPNDDLVTQSFQFRGHYDITNGNIVNACQLVNEVASY